MGEKIICAAIWFDDGKGYVHQPKNVSSGLVVAGRRHHNCFATVSELGIDFRTLGRVIQGFLTDKDRFVDRKEAAEIALKANQINKPTEQLFSEDLY